MQIEMLSTVKHQTPTGFEFVKDEIRTVDEETGRLFCAMGWARDTSGKIPTGERSTGPVALDVRDVAARSDSEI